MDDFENISVLVIEDDIELNHLIRSELELWGATTYATTTLAEARTLFEKYSPDVVVSDVRLSDGEAIEFLKSIPEVYGKSPVRIVITGFADISEEDEKEMGLDGIFPKPTNWDEVMLTIQTKLREKSKSA